MEAKGIVVVGAAGSQARAMLKSLSRALDLSGLTAVDLSWGPEARAEMETLGVEVVSGDVLSDDRELLTAGGGEVSLLVNMAGPFSTRSAPPLWNSRSSWEPTIWTSVMMSILQKSFLLWSPGPAEQEFGRSLEWAQLPAPPTSSSGPLWTHSRILGGPRSNWRGRWIGLT